MPTGKSYGGNSMQGESGKKPAMVGSKQGAYAHSANSMGGASTPNMQAWNGYDASRNQRDGSIGSGGKDTKRGGGDY